MSATLSGTRNYFDLIARRDITPSVRNGVLFGKTGWTVSPVGFGSYRVYEHEAAHLEALELALRSGCNLVDTSTNYTNGSSERAIGKVLNQLIRSNEFSRENFVVVTKVGYVQGENLEIAQERQQAGAEFPEMVRFREDCWHCISPEFIEDQINRSLSRLGLENDSIDLLLLHNPEYFLKAHPEHSEYYRRIEAAFRYLETEVQKGRIQYYGVSSNTFVEAKDHPDYTSFETLIEIAKKISPDHHFAAIQFPMNLYEPGAALELNNSGKSVLSLALEENIATLINRPLNSFPSLPGEKEKMIRLVDYPAHHGVDTETAVKESLTRCMELETQYQSQFADRSKGQEPLVPTKQIAWGHILRQNIERLAELETWTQALSYQIKPSLQRALEILSENPSTRTWALEYGEASGSLFHSFTAFLEAQAAVQSEHIKAHLNEDIPPLKTSRKLSQKAVRVLRSIPGVSSVLVGMRRPEYVKDILALDPALDPKEALLALTTDI